MNLSSLTISEASEKIRSKKCSSEELVRSCIERIENIDKNINAVVHKNFDGALEQAKKFDAKPTGSPLGGIPYLAKDVFNEKGALTTAGSKILRDKDYVSPFDATTIERLKTHGAISLGKANTDELTMGASTETSFYGVTKNPWDNTRVAGGSSGGSAAAVSADECIFALGTDTGGSIRQPAGFCGIAGLRPTYGRTSRYGVMSMASSLDTIGPMCKTVEDIAIVMEAVSGHDERDATTVRKDVPPYFKDLSKGISGLTIGLPNEYFIEGIDPEVEAAVREAANVFRQLGARIEEISLPHTRYAIATYYVIVPSEVSSNMARYDGIRFGHTVENPKDLTDYYERVRSEGFGAEVKRRIMIGTYALSAGYFDAYYRQAQKVRTLIAADFTNAFRNVDIILSPVSPTPAFKIGAHDDDPVGAYLEDIFTTPQPMAGIPALSLPCGFSGENLPISLQLAGPHFSEDLLLQAGFAYQQATGWHTRKPPVEQ